MAFSLVFSVKAIFFVIIVWLIITVWINVLDKIVDKFLKVDSSSFTGLIIKALVITLIGLAILKVTNYHAGEILGVFNNNNNT